MVGIFLGCSSSKFFPPPFPSYCLPTWGFCSQASFQRRALPLIDAKRGGDFDRKNGPKNARCPHSWEKKGGPEWVASADLCVCANPLMSKSPTSSPSPAGGGRQFPPPPVFHPCLHRAFSFFLCFLFIFLFFSHFFFSFFSPLFFPFFFHLSFPLPMGRVQSARICKSSFKHFKD